MTVAGSHDVWCGMTWIEALRQWDAWQAAADRPATTRTLRRHQLARLAAAFPDGPESVTGPELVAWMSSHDWATETMRSHRAALTTFFAWALRHGVVTSDPTTDLPPVRRHLGTPRPVADEVWRAAADEADETMRLAIELGARAGLRRAEIAAVAWLDAGDVSEAEISRELRVSRTTVRKALGK